jgi:hypothetical protein
MLRLIFVGSFVAFISNCALSLVWAKTLNDILDEVVKPKQNLNKEACEFGDETKKFGLSYKNVRLQITNKILGKTEFVNFEVQKIHNYDFLNIKPSKCCMGEDGESYTFLTIQNTKSKKEVFKGWMLSHASSINPFEDSKFDIIPVKCF